MNVLVIVFFGQLFSQSCGYYWREYNGKIPSDAIVAGTDINKELLYIGQGFVSCSDCGPPGIFPTTIQKGKEIFVPTFGAKKADNFVQILCGEDPENFHWEPANSTHLHLLGTSNELVRSGVEDHRSLSIGRVKYQGEICIGKVLGAHIGNAEMWFVHNGNEIKSDSYEVLTYNDVASKIGVRVASK